MYIHQQKCSQANPLQHLLRYTVLAQGFRARSPYKPFAFLFRGVGKGYGLGKRREENKCDSLFLVDSYVKISSMNDMVKLSLLFLVLLVTTTYARIGPDGTGIVNGYNIQPGADLRDADLTGAELSGANLIYADLSNADLTGADLSGADLRNANLIYTDLSGADLNGADLDGAYLTRADLTGADLSGANLNRADLRDATLTGVTSGNITGTPTVTDGYQMASGYIVGPSVDLTGADLSGAVFTRVTSGNITGTPTLPDGYQMAGGYIVGPYTDLTGADLTGADLSGADLIGVISGNITGDPMLPYGYQMINGYIVGPSVYLTGADLSGTDLSNADLRMVNLSGADLSGANLNGADLDGAYLRDTIWSNVISPSDYDAVVAERDARPTQAAYNTVVAERDARLTMDEVRDARVGSTMIEVSGAKADITMTLEETSDLSDWSDAATSDKTIQVDAPAGIRFYRFKMAE